MHEAERRESNAEAIRQLAQHRVQLEQRVWVDHYAYFVSEASAKEFVVLMVKNGHERVEHLEPRGSSFGVRVRLEHKLTLDDVNAVSIEVERATEMLGGEYDGWGVDDEQLEKIDGCFGD
ncbi:MAG: ribonuclease E inhibitor RraB [Fimbriimonadaceae bacterium]|nr:ribonuclease E inhibitor RraB [Fimbriimonadaceae bacterium]